MPAKLQYEAAFQTSRLLRHVDLLAARARSAELQVDAAVAEFRDGVRQLEAEIASAAHRRRARERFEEGRKQLRWRPGVPPALAARIASLEALNAALDIVEIARGAQASVSAETARVYFEVGTRIGLDWLRDADRAAHRRRSLAGDRAHRPARRARCASTAA